MKKRKLATGILSEVANWTVLIVDDTPDNLMVAKTALQFHGAKVYTAMNGEEGLQSLRTLKPTVILLDIRMPKMDGWEMFKFIRKNPATAEIPIIAITAYAMESDREDILAGGFNGYIPKPFDIFTFVEEIAKIIQRATLNQQESQDAKL